MLLTRPGRRSSRTRSERSPPRAQRAERGQVAELGAEALPGPDAIMGLRAVIPRLGFKVVADAAQHLVPVIGVGTDEQTARLPDMKALGGEALRLGDLRR